MHFGDGFLNFNTWDWIFDAANSLFRIQCCRLVSKCINSLHELIPFVHIIYIKIVARCLCTFNTYIKRRKQTMWILIFILCLKIVVDIFSHKF